MLTFLFPFLFPISVILAMLSLFYFLIHFFTLCNISFPLFFFFLLDECISSYVSFRPSIQNRQCNLNTKELEAGSIKKALCAILSMPGFILQKHKVEHQLLGWINICYCWTVSLNKLFFLLPVSLIQ